MIVLDKPSGLLAVPGLGPENRDNLADRVAEFYSGTLVVHRLDRDTSGLMVMARDAETHRHLSRQFHDRRVEKKYIAVVHGVVAEEAGIIDRPLKRDFARPPRYRVDFAYGRAAVTHWRVIERLADRTRLALTPLTGRSHQLRVHLESLGHPILGDKLYPHPQALALADRLLLHATELTLEHPQSGERMHWTIACPF